MGKRGIIRNLSHACMVFEHLMTTLGPDAVIITSDRHKCLAGQTCSERVKLNKILSHQGKNKNKIKCKSSL
jgi:hypothetical protein